MQQRGVVSVNIPSWVLGIFVSLVGLGFTAMGFFYARIKNAEELARERGVVLTKLDVIEKKVEKLSNTICNQQSLCASRGERIASIEASVKSAHQRIDSIESKIRGCKDED